MDIELLKSLLFFLAGGFLLFLAVTVARDNISNRLNRVTGAMLFFAGLGPIFAALADIISGSLSTTSFDATVTYHLHPIWEFFFPVLLVFAWTFPVDRLSSFKHKRVQYLVFLPQVVNLLLLLFYDPVIDILGALEVDPSEQGFATLIKKPIGRLASWVAILLSVVRTYEGPIFGIINLSYVLLAGYFLETGKLRITNPRLAKQTSNLMWAMRVGLGLWALAMAGEMLFPRRFDATMQDALMLLAVLGGAGWFAYATIRYQFLDLRLVFRQSFVYTLSSGLLVGGFVLVVVKAEQLLSPMFGENAQVFSYAFIVLILLLFQPINSWLDNLIRSLFMRTRTDHRNVLERFSRQVISVFDPTRLRQTIEDTMKTALLVERVSFVMFDDSVGEYAMLPSDGSKKRRVLDREDMMLRGINLLDTPTFYNSLTDFREGSRLAQMLEENRTQLIVPMKDAKHLLGFLALSDKAAGYKYSSEDINLLNVLSNQMVTALTNARLYVESLERMRLQEEVTMARQIQLDLLPSSPPQLESAAITAYSMPSRTVGGDFYDFLQLPNGRIGVVIADASGKGMPAALMIAQIQAIIRAEVNNGNPINVMLRNMNQQMVGSSSSEKYVTLFYGELDCESRTFEYANAGHNYPVLVRANGETELLKVGGPIIGALPYMEYECDSVKLQPDDVMFFFTDGVSEAMDADEVEYGEERIHRMVCDHRGDDPKSLVEVILKDVHTHDPSEPPRDDTTIIAMKLLGPGSGNGDGTSHGE